MKLHELILLVKQGESENLEFKKTTGQRTAAAKTVCAFLNGHGGYVLFGVSDAGEISYPQCEIRMARFRGTSRLPDFSDNRQYNGNAFSLLRRAESFLLDHVPIAGRVIPGKMIREDNPWYPPPATREALANAICHRDYSEPGGAVSLAMYDDRLEVINPDQFHFGITPEKLKGPHESKPWNPLIANAFYRAGVIERWGSGTTNIITWCEDNGNPIPEWEERAGSVVVTFFPISEAGTPQVTPQVTMEVAKLLPFCLQPVNRRILQGKLGFRNADHFRKAYILPAIKGGWIEMTIPDKPKSRLQKYILTSKGRKWLEEN